MKFLLKIAVLYLLIPLFLNAKDESGISLAFKYGVKGIQLVNTGKLDSALIMFDEAIKLDPANITYPYEKALVFYQRKDYKTAMPILDSLLNHKDVNANVYELLGNCYDNTERSDKAIEIYNAGLEKFPNAGRLYMELGLIAEKTRKKSREIVSYWEKGVSVDPQYPYNYYYLAMYYSKTGEKLWTMLYGELFIYLTDNKSRITEMSNLLYKTCFEAIAGDSGTGSKFTGVKVLTGSESDNAKWRFEDAYQKTMDEAVKQLFGNNIKMTPDNFFALRRKFIEVWLKKGYNAKFQNILFDWHRKLIDNNLFEAYNVNMFIDLDMHHFRNWFSTNKKVLDKFSNWLKTNTLVLDEKNKFSRFQYDN